MMKSKLMKTVVSAALLSVSATAALASDGMRQVEAERLLVIDTNKGRILVEMNPDIAPLHVERIRRLAGEGFYDNVKWHRVIDGFMAQTGDPTATGEGSSPYENLKAELTFRRSEGSTFTTVAQPMGLQVGFMDTVPVHSQSDHYMARSPDGRVPAWGTYCPGVAGMARAGSPDSANSQFYLMMGQNDNLNGAYTVFGRVVQGLDVVSALKAGNDANDGAVGPDADVMTRARLASSMPEAERPTIRVAVPGSAPFNAAVEAARAAKGASFGICDVQPPVQGG